MTRREAQRLVREHGGVPLGRCDSTAHVIVIGADVLSLDDEEALLDGKVRQAADEGRIEIITETQFWQHLGLMETEPSEPRLYTPAMLAELLGVSVATIRRWHRRGLIKPVKEIHRLPYFDFQEVATCGALLNCSPKARNPRSSSESWLSFPATCPTSIDRWPNYRSSWKGSRYCSGTGKD